MVLVSQKSCDDSFPHLASTVFKLRIFIVGYFSRWAKAIEEFACLYMLISPSWTIDSPTTHSIQLTDI